MKMVLSVFVLVPIFRLFHPSSLRRSKPVILYSSVFSDSNIPNRKEKATAGVFAKSFGTSEALYIVADIYHGVSDLP
jgi:hypothetical protein